MDPAIEQIIRNLTERLEACEAFMNNLGFDPSEIFQGAGTYVASSPTADGTIPVTYKGQRFNVLVDKV